MPSHVQVSFRTAPLSFADSGDGKTYASDFAVIVRFLDGQNNVVRKVSQHYELRGPIGGCFVLAGGARRLTSGRPEQAAFVTAAETALRDAKPYKFNAFKVELAKRAIVRALTNVAAMS